MYGLTFVGEEWSFREMNFVWAILLAHMKNVWFITLKTIHK